jgi:hypothetical protein
MSTRVRTIRLLSVALGCFWSLPAAAEAVLLAECRHNALYVLVDRTDAADLPDMIGFRFTAFDADSISSWIVDATTSDAGRTFLAPPNVLASFNQIEYRNMVYHGWEGTIYGLPLGSWETDVLQFGWGNFDGVPGSTQVTDAFGTLPITKMEMTLDSVFATSQQGGFNNYGGEMTVRLFGEVVPEPSSAMLVALCLIGWHGAFIRAFVRRR